MNEKKYSLKTRKEVCLARLDQLIESNDDMVNFLVEEKIMNSDDVTEYGMSAVKSKFLLEKITQAEKDEKFMLVSFDWEILPVERIRIRLVTERTNKEFTYKY